MGTRDTLSEEKNAIFYHIWCVQSSKKKGHCKSLLLIVVKGMVQCMVQSNFKGKKIYNITLLFYARQSSLAINEKSFFDMAKCNKV